MRTFLAYAKTRFEFPIALEIARRGIVVSVLAQKYTYRKGRGVERETCLGEMAALPNILFLSMNTEDQRRLTNIRGLSQTFQALEECSMRDVMRFRTDLDLRNEAVEREYARSGAMTPQFASGASVEPTEGPMADLIGQFRKVVKIGDEIACQVEFDMMERKVLVNVPPDLLREVS